MALQPAQERGGFGPIAVQTQPQRSHLHSHAWIRIGLGFTTGGILVSSRLTGHQKLQPGPLFLAVDRDGDVRAGRISAGAVYQILARLQQAAKVKPFSPHDCRRSYITPLLGTGNSIAVVQKLAGHASVNTTARYDRSDEDAKRKAAETLHVPFAA